MNLENTPLTESILQKLYKSKTYVRDGQWDILWHLGGKNNVTIGEKEGIFYYIPPKNIETVVEMLPCGIVSGQHVSELKEPSVIHNLEDLGRIYPELIDLIHQQKIKI